MNLLKDISLSDLDTLCGIFAQHKRLGGLNEKQFIEAFSTVFTNSGVEFGNEEILKHLFASIDVLGEGRVSWENFSMYVIELNLRGRSLKGEKGSSPTETGEMVFCPYRLKQVAPNPVGSFVSEMQVIPKANKIVKILKDSAGQSLLELREATHGHALRGVIQPQDKGLVAWDYIPLTPGVPYSNSIACSYHGGFMRLFTVEKSYKVNPELKGGENINIRETQNSLRWLPSCAALAMGSRSGVVSLWNTCGYVIMRKRIFYRPVTSIQTIHNRNHMLYAASSDRTSSVKCFDFERQLACFSFDDHKMGGVMVMEKDDNLFFSVGLEPHIIQRPLFCPNVPPVQLYDRISPHKGRITSLERMKNMPFLVSGDLGGNIKFWDVRMGACVQTIPSFTSLATGRNSQMTTVQIDGRGYVASSIYSICHIDAIDTLSVTTAREQLTLTAETALHPDLVDDCHTCRFVFFLNAEDIITVHERGVKLWSASTGILVDSKPNMVHSDITACCAVLPLNRQVLLGTMEGELMAFSVSLLRCTIELTSSIKKFIHKSEIVFLDVIQKYRDLPSLYALVVTAGSLLLVPLVSGCSAQSVVQMQAVKNILTPGQSIRTAIVTPSYILVATSNGDVHIVDYQQLLTVAHTFTFSFAVETIIACPACACTELKSPRAPPKSFIVFLVDVAGTVHIAALRTTSKCVRSDPSHTRRRSSVFAVPRFEIVGEWVPSRPGSWASPSRRLPTAREKPMEPAPGRGRSIFGRLPSLTNPNAHEHGFNGTLTRKSMNVSCGMENVYSGLSAVASSAILFALLERYGAVATADEDCVIKLWDVREHMEKCQSRHGSVGAPVLVTSWSAPGNDIVYLSAAEHPTLRLPLLLLATGDMRVSVWTPDGAALGTLATGRETDEASGGRRFGLPPYTLCADGTTVELWEKFLSHAQGERQRSRRGSSGGSSDPQPPPMPPPPPMFSRRATRVCKAQYTDSEKNTSAKPFFFPSVAGAQAMQSTVSMESGVHDSAQRMRHDNFMGFVEPLDDDDDYDYEDDEGEREAYGNTKAGRILKFMHRGLVTRTAVSVSLGQTGTVGLPKLKKRSRRHRH